MDIYIDCEWNGFGGDFISMALVAADGKEFYEVIECEDPCDWVEQNVIPVLNKEAIEPDVFQEKLQKYLSQFKAVNIIADWPEDIERFCSALITGPGTRIDTPSLSMQIVRIETKSALPHNALEDARGIRNYFRNATPPTT